MPKLPYLLLYFLFNIIKNISKIAKLFYYIYKLFLESVLFQSDHLIWLFTPGNVPK